MSNILSNPEEFDDEIESVDCPRCKCCEMFWEECYQCGGEGGTDGDELMMEDPMWYSKTDYRTCDICDGKGGWHKCDCDENGKHQ